ncbi:MAG: ArsA family ATPase [Acidimicrobiales bacterium]
MTPASKASKASEALEVGRDQAAGPGGGGSTRRDPGNEPPRPHKPREPRQPHQPRRGSLDGLLAAKEIVVACGPGGVGKTTTAAAVAAVAAWRHGGRVLVLTVDPARRLADALGLEGIGNAERRIPPEVFTSAGVTPRGELWAAMLDTKQSWDDLVRRHAPDDETREKILDNALYQNISGRFVQSHDYIAMERLYELHSEGAYDLIVVDTPPTRNALDFLDAPERMADFFSSRLLRWLIVPYRSRLVNLATKPFYQVADRILGTQFLADISEFFILFQSMYDGFVERAGAVTRLLSDRRTTFMVVSTLEATPVREAEFFATELVARRLHLGAMVLNKVLPAYFRDPGAGRVAHALAEQAAELTDGLPTDPAQTTRVLKEVAESFLNFGVVARREAEQQAELGSAPEVLASVPFFESDIYDMAGLLRLGQQIWD